jgi:hypothetical protein
MKIEGAWETSSAFEVVYPLFGKPNDSHSIQE